MISFLYPLCAMVYGLTDWLHVLGIVLSVVIPDLFEHLVDAALVQSSLASVSKRCHTGVRRN